jgi:hypothetical protein
VPSWATACGVNVVKAAHAELIVADLDRAADAEGEMGMLRAAARADLIVLSANPLETDPRDLVRIRQATGQFVAGTCFTWSATRSGAS